MIEEKCTDEYGYLEAFDRYFRPASNEKLSENGVLAEKTMNTLLHVFEAYTELYRVTHHSYTAEQLAPITEAIVEHIYARAYQDHSVLNEAENGVDDTKRVWWIQAESIVGFVNAWQKKTDEKKYLEAAKDIWGYIRSYFVDPREGSEWFEM